MSPQRIQRKRTKGWRMPEGAVYVGRPTKWGNPHTYESLDREYNGLVEHTRASLVWAFGCSYLSDDLPVDRDEIRTELAGRDLACWCPLSEPCHADVLLRIANAGEFEVYPQ